MLSTFYYLCLLYLGAVLKYLYLALSILRLKLQLSYQGCKFSNEKNEKLFLLTVRLKKNLILNIRIMLNCPG